MTVSHNIEVISLAMRAGLAVILLPAAVRKLLDWSQFVCGTLDYDILPESMARMVGLVLPWAELGTGLALLCGVILPVAGAAAMLLIGAFVIAVGVNVRRGRRVGCNCYGLATTPHIGWGTIARNGVLFAQATAVTMLSLAGGGAAADGAWWRLGADAALLTSGNTALIALLLAAWCVAVTHLVEWGMEIQAGVAPFVTLRERASAGGEAG